MQVRRWTSSLRDDFGYAWVAGLAMAAATAFIAVVYDLPVRDPDGIIPSYIRMPLIIVVAILADIVPRVLWRARRAPRTVGATWLEVTRERWPASHWRFAVGGVLAWYLTYATFRNIKSFVPFVNEHVYDEGMAKLDRILWLGNNPSTVLHDLLGTQWAATFLSLVYIIWIVLVPATIAIALVFTRNTHAGSWYVTAIAFDWALGAAIYLMFPSIGPIYSTPQLFDDLKHTYVTDLANSMWADRVTV
uniref:phosphatase PAP2 family protein n=1 Tax=Nocardioides sp. TaxID=35761 RepID=UPI00286AB651